MRFYVSKNYASYKKFEKLALFNFLSNAPNVILCFLTALTANTMVAWVDTLVCFGEVLHTFIVWVVARKLRKETGDKYNFGLERLEVFYSFVCDLIVAITMSFILFGAIWGIKYPSAPTSSLLFYCIIKTCNSIYDFFMYLKHSQICRTHNTKLNQTEKIFDRNALINDLAVAIVVTICYFFRSYLFVQYFSPIVSIILAVWFIYGYVRHIIKSVSEITDVSVSPKEQDEIYDAVMECGSDMLKHIVSVNCRRLNEKTHVEVALVMKEDVKYSEIEKYQQNLQERVNQIDSTATVVIVFGAPQEV